MDKTAIKTFAINSRKKLMEDVEYKMSLVGIDKDNIYEPISSANGIETINLVDQLIVYMIMIFQKEKD